MTDTTHSLQTLTDEFSRWRQTRTYVRAAVPDALRQKALAMLTRHSTAAVVEALGVTHSMLRRWALDHADSGMDSAFISLPLATQETQTADDASMTLTISLNASQQIRLQGQFSPEQLTALMRSIVTGMEVMK